MFFVDLNINPLATKENCDEGLFEMTDDLPEVRALSKVKERQKSVSSEYSYNSEENWSDDCDNYYDSDLVKFYISLCYQAILC